MKPIDWTPILIPILFAAAIAGCAMMVGSLIKNKEPLLLDPKDVARTTQTP